MSAPLDDLASYSTYVYTVAERHPIVTGSTLALAPIGATLAKLEGPIECQGGIHLEVWELIDFAAHRIRTYSYEVYREGEKICWYDPWPHPEIPALASTFPHHRHVPTCATIACRLRGSVSTRRIGMFFWKMCVAWTSPSATADAE